MAGGANIPIAVDAKEAISGAKKVEGALEDVIDSLDDLGDSGKDSSRELDRSLDDSADSAKDMAKKVGDSFDDIGDDAKKAGKAVDDRFGEKVEDTAKQADHMEDKFSDAFKQVRKDADKTGDSVGKEMKRGSKKAEGATSEFKDEAKANFSEVTSSFTGDMDSIADLAQGTFGGLASTGGPIGLAAGAIAAAGGLFYSVWKENSEKTEQAVQDMYDDMAESGSEYLSGEYVRQQASDIIKGSEDAIISRKELNRIVGLTGMTEAEVALAFAGDMETRREMERRLRGDIQLETDAIEALGDTDSDRASAQRQQHAQRAGDLQNILGRIGRQREAEDESAGRARTNAEARAVMDGYTIADLDLIKKGVDNIPSSRSTTIHVRQTGVDVDKIKRQLEAMNGRSYSAGFAVNVGRGVDLP